MVGMKRTLFWQQVTQHYVITLSMTVQKRHSLQCHCILSIVMLSVYHAWCRLCYVTYFIIMLSVIILNVIMPSVLGPICLL
jgi:hypothetical protein